MVLSQLVIHSEKIKLDLCVTLNMKIHFRWVQRQTLKKIQKSFSVNTERVCHSRGRSVLRRMSYLGSGASTADVITGLI